MFIFCLQKIKKNKKNKTLFKFVFSGKHYVIYASCDIQATSKDHMSYSGDFVKYV